MYGAAQNVKRREQVDMLVSEYYDHFQFRRNRGKIYQWTS